MPGLFSIFNTAKSGLFSQQTAINVTSHNIANSNTDGYSRQRANLVTTTPYTMPSMDNAAGAGQLGTGVTVESIQRIRDSFLDYQYRVSNGISGDYTARDKYLKQVEDIMNEPTDNGISKLMTKFFTSWSNLATSSQNSNTVKQQAEQVTNALNNTYSQLSSLKDNATTQIKSEVVSANGLLDQISQLNSQIKGVKLAGDNPNDLMDSRDLLLDKLSKQFGIDVNEKNLDGIDVTTTKNGSYGGAPTLDTTPPTTLNIIQSDKSTDPNVATFSYVNSITETSTSGVYDVTYYKKGNTLTDTNNNKVTIKVNMTEDQKNQLDQCRVLWASSDGTAYKATTNTDGSQTISVSDSKINSGDTVNFAQLALFKPQSGELKGYMSVQDDVAGYQDQLNKFAKSLAMSVNAIISQSSKWVKDNPTDGSEGGINNFFVNSDQKDASGYSATDENNITAANISVNVKILNDASLIKRDTKYDSKGNSLSSSTSTDGNRALAIAKLADSHMNIQDVQTDTKREDLLAGGIFSSDSTINNVYDIGNKAGGSTINNYFDDIVNKVGMNEQESKGTIATTATQLQSFEQSRSSDSGVSIDEEMTNLIQFQHSYQANAKMISTIDQLLDVVINGLRK